GCFCSGTAISCDAAVGSSVSGTGAAQAVSIHSSKSRAIIRFIGVAPFLSRAQALLRSRDLPSTPCRRRRRGGDTPGYTGPWRGPPVQTGAGPPGPTAGPAPAWSAPARLPPPASGRAVGNRSHWPPAPADRAPAPAYRRASVPGRTTAPSAAGGPWRNASSWLRPAVRAARRQRGRRRTVDSKCPPAPGPGRQSPPPSWTAAGPEWPGDCSPRTPGPGRRPLPAHKRGPWPEAAGTGPPPVSPAAAAPGGRRPRGGCPAPGRRRGRCPPSGWSPAGGGRSAPAGPCSTRCPKCCWETPAGRRPPPAAGRSAPAAGQRQSSPLQAAPLGAGLGRTVPAARRPPAPGRRHRRTHCRTAGAPQPRWPPAPGRLRRQILPPRTPPRAGAAPAPGPRRSPRRPWPGRVCAAGRSPPAARSSRSSRRPWPCPVPAPPGLPPEAAG
ncbi:preprotein translocase subunit SecY, partial [Dysosmobacter welbionis]